MRFKEPHAARDSGLDLTPMIDVTFQLIIFFMLLLNFTDAEQDQRVKLPVSELAKPPDAAYDEPLTIQLTGSGLILFANQELNSLEQLKVALRRETQIIQSYEEKPVEDVTIIIRADRNAQTGMVQEIIQVSQEAGFQKFALRGKQGQVRISQDER
jgi:biopolymer transport protein ExbD